MLQRRITILLFVLLVVAIGFALLESGETVPERSVLVVRLEGSYPDSPGVGLVDRLQGRTPLALPTLTLQLRKAEVDERIQGVLLHIRGVSIGWAQRRELFDAIRALRKTGKRVVALLDFAKIGASTELYLASAADQTYIVPGFLGPVTGLAGELTLLGGLADQVGVAVEYERIGAYKSAPESYAAKQLSAPAREMYTELFDGLFADLIDVVATGRDLEPQTVRAIIDAGPGTAQEWVDAGLADGIAGREDVLETAGFEDLEEVSLGSYVRVDPRDLGLRSGPKIALIFGEGAIVPGGGSTGFGADRVADALRDAASDEAYRAIVLRINSGGGSALASEQIWRAVRDAREKKPVVVSMGDAAASGGYYVASAANAVVAQPTTQTGSIGVFILRPSLGGLFDKLGIETELMTRGQLAGLGASGQRLTDPQRELLRKLVSATYDEFLGRVSEGRDMPREQVDGAGQGRVWLGSRALELGLIDDLGGLEVAFERAKQESGIGPELDPERVVLPPPAPLAVQIRELIGARAESGWIAELLGRVPAPWRGIWELDAGPALVSPMWLPLD